MFRRCSFILSLISLVTFKAYADQKADLWKGLRAVQDSYEARRKEVEKSIISQILSTQTVHITNKGEKQAQHNLDNAISQIEDQHIIFYELKQRMYLVDRLIFLVDTKYTNGQNPKKFFGDQLLDMVYTELMNSAGIHGAEFPIWKFMLGLSFAIREIHNPHEDIVKFIDSYISYLSVTELKSPLSFLREGNYINGSQVQTANPIPADRVGEAWEEQVKKMGGVLPDFAPADTTLNESRIGLPEALGQPNDPIKSNTIFDQESRVSPTEDAATPYRFEYEGYSRF